MPEVRPCAVHSYPNGLYYLQWREGSKRTETLDFPTRQEALEEAERRKFTHCYYGGSPVQLNNDYSLGDGTVVTIPFHLDERLHVEHLKEQAGSDNPDEEVGTYEDFLRSYFRRGGQEDIVWLIRHFPADFVEPPIRHNNQETHLRVFLNQLLRDMGVG